MVANASPSGKHSLINEAISYRERGWSVFPTQGKKPAVPEWGCFREHPAGGRELSKLFARPGVDGIAVILGEASGGLVARDFDREDSYDRWAGEHKELASSLPTVQTARGKHVYFHGPSGFANLPDGEYRGDDGHYCLVPPSLHPSGQLYRWLIEPAEQIPSITDPAGVGLLPASCKLSSQKSTTIPCNTADTSNVDAGGCRGEKEYESYAEYAGLHELGECVEEAVLRTLPTREGERNLRVFDLARGLKALPNLHDADPTDLEHIVRHWHTLALPVIGTKPFEETLIDFIVGWDRVKFTAGDGPLDHAFAVARGRFPAVAMRYDDPRMGLLIALCAELQRTAGDRPFFLACRSAGRLLGVHYSTASRWLFLLRRQRILKLITLGQRETKKASEYRYLGG